MWKIKKFQGMTELTLSAEVELVSTTTERKTVAQAADIDGLSRADVHGERGCG